MTPSGPGGGTERRPIGHIFHDRSDGWMWNGEKRWWEIEKEVIGYNDRLGYWIKERWHWNRNDQMMYEGIRTLTPEESDELEKQDPAPERE